jgi:hypothetical protein
MSRRFLESRISLVRLLSIAISSASRVEFVYESFYAGVSRGGGHIHLKCSPPPLRDQTAFERAEQIDVYVCVQGVKMLAESFAATGAAFVVPLRHMPYGIEFYLRDPDGYVLGFVESISASS